jgi:glycerol-3-phosphate acyltransferase PlsY
MTTTHRIGSPTAMALGAAAGYLVGSLSFSRFVGSRAAPGEDLNVTHIEVQEVGATVEFHGVTPTSVKEHAGAGAAMLTVALEAAKAALPTLAARVLLPNTPAAPAAAAGAVVGHVLPLWNGLRLGGYGMSPMLGGMLVLDPVGLVVTTASISGLIEALHDRRIMMAWPVAVPAWEAVRGRRDLVVYGLVANGVYWARLVPELRRGLGALLSTRRPVPAGSVRDDVAAAEGDHSREGENGPAH